MRDAHQAYSSYLNRRQGLGGRLWQGRFYSTVLDDKHLWAAVAYVERNPVRAGLVQAIRQKTATGRCYRELSFIERLEKILCRPLKPQKPSRKRKKRKK